MTTLRVDVVSGRVHDSFVACYGILTSSVTCMPTLRVDVVSGRVHDSFVACYGIVTRNNTRI